MEFPNFDPVWFSIGPIPIRWYALAYVAGIVLGWWYAARLVKRESVWAPAKPPVTGPQLDDLVLWITLGIILGGRFGYALFYKPGLYGQVFTGDSIGERLELFQIWTGQLHQRRAVGPPHRRAVGDPVLQRDHHRNLWRLSGGRRAPPPQPAL